MYSTIQHASATITMSSSIRAASRKSMSRTLSCNLSRSTSSGRFRMVVSALVCGLADARVHVL